MENPRRSNRGVEENTLAILDSSGIKDARDSNDDRLFFLEAVRSASLVSDSSAVPTWNMYDAVFHVLSDGASLEQIMTSYQLLTELDKRYPRVYLVHPERSEPSCSGVGELVVVKEAWSPLVVGSENTRFEGEGTSRSSDDLLDPSRFSFLTQEIVRAASELDFQLRMKPLKDMLLFVYLVNVIEGDFLPRQIVYRETMNWLLLRESLLNMLLGSRKLNFKSFIRDCMTIISKRCHHIGVSLNDLKKAENSMTETVHDSGVALAFTINELEKKTCIAVEKLLSLVMELDVNKKEADLQGYTSRADALRTPLLEIILDELTYNKELISPFLQVFSEPKWKLEIVLQYFWKYCAKSSVCTRRSNDSSNNVTFEGVLNHLSTASGAKNIVRKITMEVAQLLLAHAFQAYLSLQRGLKLVNNGGTSGGSSVMQISKDIISAYQNIRKNNEDMDIMPFEKEALFTASTILSMES